MGTHPACRPIGLAAALLLGLGLAVLPAATEAAKPGGPAPAAFEPVDLHGGICAVLGLPKSATPGDLNDLARSKELTVYFQSPDAAEIAAVRQAAAKANLLGHRVFVDSGPLSRVHLADNLAGAVVVADRLLDQVDDQEVLRVLHPAGKALLGQRRLVKPLPEGTDDWSHPYHGPDNNPQSTDQLARAPYLTQFLGEPKFSPMPEVTVMSGGRVFRAFGHIAHRANQNAMLNTLLCVNAYNGAILWRRPLSGKFMIHRNTMIATPEVLYLADHQSCKLIDARTGRIRDEIVISTPQADGPVWKWMALVDGVLYALVGGQETPIHTQRSDSPALGHWPWGMWEGHDYADPKTSFGFGRTFLAIDPATKKVLWTHREKDYLDSRGVSMGGGRIYFYAPEKMLGCLDARSGKVLWKNSDADLLEAIGPNGRAQHYVTGYATQTYIKCHGDRLLFAGPQRSRLVVASTRDGRLLWQREGGNLQLVLRDDGFYAAGPQQTGCKLSYDGKVLARLPRRRACTRATGSVDSVFFRTPGGTVRIDAATNTPRHIAPMRPPCQDGVIISGGYLYWGPWMCGCQLSFYGHIALGPAGDFDFHPGLDDSQRQTFAENLQDVKPLEIAAGDWPTYGGDNAHHAHTQVALPKAVAQAWRFRLPEGSFPTAPVAAGGMVFLGDRTGAVHALRADSGEPLWQAYTAGAVYYPPVVDGGRLFVGSADGRVHAFEAATGRPLWSFRVGPAERWIPVYDKLISTWPVAGGVVVDQGVVYAAAGIAHYDGTYVVALDAASGKPRWYNDTSGTISTAVQSGISLQGPLAIRGGQLQFLGGGAYETAQYDLATGKCLNRPNDQPSSAFHTAFYAYYPHWGQYLSLDYTFDDGRELVYDVTYEGSWQSPLALMEPLPAGTPKPFKPASRWGIQRRRGGPRRKALWQLPPDQRFHGFVVGPAALLAAGERGSAGGKTSFLAAVNLDDGKPIWVEKLSAPVVKGGTAVDAQGRIFVSLAGDEVVCFQGR